MDIRRMKNFLAIILLILIIALLPCSSFATPVSFSFGGALRISDSLPINHFSDLLEFGTGRIFTADPSPDPLLIAGGYTSKNRVEIADLHLSGSYSVDNGGTIDTADDYTVFDISPSVYLSGFKVQNPLGTIDYLIADLKTLSMRTRGGTGNINANELSINLSNIILTPAGEALNSYILSSLKGSTKGDILTVTMQYTGNLEYIIKSGLAINASYSGTVSLPANSGDDDGQGELVPEPNSLFLFGSGIIGLAVFMVLRKRKSYFI